ncbi:vitellogenin [Tribolium castaneum]|uniref:Vitellogenin-like Protein n=1 Tax=Tribolium castaneum TaxID=7070 RepID=D6W7J2_TRICA|nr:PREDICTED: vitellogenin [Tribolium castaneum]EFA11302.1 Vitellogenin-like Protein [Tribolium castaneum]|eukprot:XP_970210.1 PREDICTED: vitellogenin [Tribolium castaneum]
MWSKIVLCFFVGLACASHNPGWQHNHEYVYQIRGRSLTGLDQISSNHAGMLFKAKLWVRPRSDGHLGARIIEPQYAEIHSKLYRSWDQEIPDSELSYSPISLSSKPFLIKMDNNAVSDLVVDRSISNWEANMIKAIVSQLQLDTNAENLIPSSINILTQEGSSTAVFKTMEPTVTGESETLYEIHPLPDYILQTTPWLAPLKHLKGRGQVIEVVKNKNFTHSKETPSYHFGFHGVDRFDIDNQIGEFFSRTSVSRAVITGNLDSFTLQSSVTVDEVTVNPSMQDKQRGSTRSIVNITLVSMDEQNQEFEQVSNPVNVGLVYHYDNPFDQTNEPHLRSQIRSGRKNSDESSSSHSQESSNQIRRHKRSLSHASSESDESRSEELYSSVQEKPHINEAPASPLLPFTVGYDGQAISKKQNIKESARNLAKKIGQEFQQSQNIPERNTVGKFLILSSLVKVMDKDEMKQVADQLYTQEQHGAAAAAWVAYRDAVAEAGTGPALLNIQEWIREGKISREEAAEVVSTAAVSARQPTEKYMKVYFEMIQNDQIMEQPYLNESLLLAYTTLIHQVYVNEEYSHSKYPVHSFGSFNTAQGWFYVKKEVIPYLSQKLDEAISNADTKQIHLYIRALGNVGHQQILQSFKPYLEGTKKASHFQRTLMVVALDKLAKSNPQVARSVLYKIYQNAHDFDQVRVAAVYQLMKSQPSAAMLQRMAYYTNVDTSNQVNAAVKSIIESACELQGPRYEKIRSAAYSAKPLLTSQDFGVQHSHGNLRSFVEQEMRSEYLQKFNYLVGEDSVLPKGINYYLQGRFGGVRRFVVDMQSMVSSIEDLINVFEQQTKEYRRLLKEKQAAQSANTKWSSEHTANLFNMQNEQREQLEGNLYFHVDALQKMWSFDNQTIENLLQIVRKCEQDLKNGKHIDYNKMSVNYETALSFPSAWGLPLIYTFDVPTLVHIESEMQASANPSVYSEQGLQQPETVDLEYKINAFVSGRVQSQLGFFAPFNHKRYSSGYDKNFQVVVPQISGKVHLNVENKQATLEAENTDSQKNTNLVHYSSWPYTSVYEIFDVEPKNQIIEKENPHRVNTIIGDKSTGIAFYFKMISSRPIDCGFMYDRLRKQDLVSALLGSWVDDNMQHIQIDLGIDSDKSTTNKVVVHLGHQHTYNSNLNRQPAPEMSSRYQAAQESWERQKEFLKNCSKDIRAVRAHVVDAIVLFEGQRIVKYTSTLAGARSDIDPRGRVLMQMEKDNQHDKPMRVFFAANTKIPNTNSLNLKYALEFDPTSTIQIQGVIEKKSGNDAQINAKLTLAKSEERKQYLKELPQYEKCQKEMQEGNYQLPACAMLTAQANLLDQFSFEMNYHNIDKVVVNSTYKLYTVLRHYMYPRVSEDILMENEQVQKDRLQVKGQFSPCLSRVNASVVTEYGKVDFNNVKVQDWAKALLVSHPVHHVKSRLGGYALNYETYKANCMVDSCAVNTLDNRTFPIDLSKDWVVLLHYVPRRPSPIKNQPYLTVPEQLNQQVEGYIVYGRSYGDAKKEIKMVIQSPDTLSKVIDISLKPSESSSYPRLFVQGQEIKYDDQGSHMYDGYMQAYRLPNQETKVQVYNAFSVIYDGVRAKIEITNDKFRDAARGLCGTFTNEQETDFTHPGNCIIHNPEVFVATNTVPEKQRTKRMNEMMMIQAEEKKCYRKSVQFVKIVSAQDSGIMGGEMYAREGIMYRTQYALAAGQTCFSISPVPVCKDGYKQVESLNRPVPAHCVESSQLARSLRRQIDQGANPSFKSKPQHREVMMQMAKRCEA